MFDRLIDSTFSYKRFLPSGKGLRRCCAICLLGVFLWPAQPSIGQTNEEDESCTEAIEASESLFFQAQFEAAIKFLDDCLSSDAILRANKPDAYLMLARVHFAAQDKALAAEAIERLFVLKPDYEGAPPLPPPFIKFVAEIKEIYESKEVLEPRLLFGGEITEQKRRTSKRWLWIGGGGLFAVTAVAIMSGGDSSRPGGGFPLPPGTPEQ